MTLMFFTFPCMSTRTVASTPEVLRETGISVAQVPELESEFLFEHMKRPKSLMLLRNVNIPWPDQGMGDGDYMFAFQEVVMPIAQEFDPDLVIGEKPSSDLIYRY